MPEASRRVAHPPVQLEDWPDDDRRSRLVFVTRGLAREPVAGDLLTHYRGIPKNKAMTEKIPELAVVSLGERSKRWQSVDAYVFAKVTAFPPAM